MYRYLAAKKFLHDFYHLHPQHIFKIYILPPKSVLHTTKYFTYLYYFGRQRRPIMIWYLSKTNQKWLQNFVIKVK